MLLVWGICQDEDPKSAVVAGLPNDSLRIFPHWGRMNFWLTVLTGIGPKAGVWLSLITCGDVCSDTLQTHDSTAADKVLKKTPLDLQKRFPIHHVCPKCLAARFSGSAFPENGSAFRQDLEKVGKTLVDW